MAQTDILINNKKTNALLDTEASLNVIQKSTHAELKLPKIIPCQTTFKGVGSNNRTMRYVRVEVIIDGQSFTDIFHIIKDQEDLPEIIIGLSMMNQMELTITRGKIKVRKLSQKEIDSVIAAEEITKKVNEFPMEIYSKHIAMIQKNEPTEWNELPFNGNMNETCSTIHQ